MFNKNSLTITNGLGHVTQKIFGGLVAVIPYRKKIAEDTRWVMAFQEMLEKTATDKELTGYDHRVLMYLFSITDFENWIKVPQTYIAEKLGIAVPHVSRSIKKLIKHNYIRVERMGSMNVYQINPEYIWKGLVHRRDKVIKLFKD